MIADVLSISSTVVVWQQICELGCPDTGLLSWGKATQAVDGVWSLSFKGEHLRNVKLLKLQIFKYVVIYGQWDKYRV